MVDDLVSKGVTTAEQAKLALADLGITAKVAVTEGAEVGSAFARELESNPNIRKNFKSFEKVLEIAGDCKYERILPKVKTFEQARNKALELVGDMGPGSKAFYGGLESSKGFNQKIGRVAADRKVRWYLDYDPIKGTHINVHDWRGGKGVKAKKYVIPFEATEEVYESLLKHLNR